MEVSFEFKYELHYCLKNKINAKERIKKVNLILKLYYISQYYYEQRLSYTVMRLQTVKFISRDSTN